MILLQQGTCKICQSKILINLMGSLIYSLNVFCLQLMNLSWGVAFSLQMILLRRLWHKCPSVLQRLCELLFQSSSLTAQSSLPKSMPGSGDLRHHAGPCSMVQ